MVSKAAFGGVVLFGLANGQATTSRTTSTSTSIRSISATPSRSSSTSTSVVTSTSTKTVVFSAVITNTVYGCACTPTTSLTLPTSTTRTSSGASTATTNLSTTVTLTSSASSTAIASSSTSSRPQNSSLSTSVVLSSSGRSLSTSAGSQNSASSTSGVSGTSSTTGSQTSSGIPASTSSAPSGSSATSTQTSSGVSVSASSASSGTSSASSQSSTGSLASASSQPSSGTSASSTSTASGSASSTSSAPTVIVSGSTTSANSFTGVTSSRNASSTTSAPTVVNSSTTSAANNTSTALSTTNSNNATLAPTSVSRTSTATNSSTSATATSLGGQTVSNTILILVRNSVDAANAYAGLDAYGIPYQVVLVPQGGAPLPQLNSSATQGNYGGFILVSELSYQTSSGGYASGLTDDQFSTIYAYQKAFGVRMVRLDTYPYTSAFGAEVVGQCCDTAGQEQLISFTNDTGFRGANIKLGAGMSTLGLYHYPSRITSPATTFEVAQFAPDSNSQFSGPTTAAVINDFAGRQQMVFFTAWGTQFSATSNFLQHGYIHWMTRGLFVGSRKSYFLTQVDDVHLRTALYSPAGQFYRSVPDDYKMVGDWSANLNSRLPAGSNYFVELGHNGNGDIIAATNGTNTTLCNPNTAIYYPAPANTDLEFQKPLGTGFTRWPTTPTSYTWSVACASIDALASWFMTPSNRDAFSHVSHTFTHLNQDNATYDDVNREMFFNQEWFSSISLSKANRFSPNGLIPPAITGMHNGDAIRAWAQNGIAGVVGDNSRPVLRNANTYWPLISTMASNGYDGMTIMPRWPNRIYYDCDTPACTTQEWTDRFSGTGSFTDLLALEKSTTTRYLFSLRHDPYMFHQANLRAHDAPSFTVGSQTGQFSLIQIWVETVTQEMARVTNWPLLSLKHDDMVQQFMQRMVRDQCQPILSWTYSQDGKSITGAQVGTANGNTCSAPIGVTFPGTATASSGATSDQVGSEPLIQWVNLQGSPVTFTLGSPISVL